MDDELEMCFDKMRPISNGPFKIDWSKVATYKDEFRLSDFDVCKIARIIAELDEL